MVKLRVALVLLLTGTSVHYTANFFIPQPANLTWFLVALKGQKPTQLLVAPDRRNITAKRVRIYRVLYLIEKLNLCDSIFRKLLITFTQVK